MKQPLKSATNSTRGSSRPTSNHYFFFSLCTVLLCCTPFLVCAQITPEIVAHTWKYEDVFLKTPGDHFKKVGAHDVMILRKGETENTFSYALPLENIKAKGTWLLNDSTLVFTYDSATNIPDSLKVVRYFKIQRLTKDSMLFREVLKNGARGAGFSFSLNAE